MCFGSIALLAEAWEDGGARVGRLDDGAVVSLAFVPDAEPGAHLLVHLGVPVEVLDAAEAADARAAHLDAQDPMSSLADARRARRNRARLRDVRGQRRRGVRERARRRALRRRDRLHDGEERRRRPAPAAFALPVLHPNADRRARPRDAGSGSALVALAASAAASLRPLLRGALAREGDAGGVHPQDARRLGGAARGTAPARATGAGARARDRPRRRRAGMARRRARAPSCSAAARR